jgi:hypothetical protein
MVTIISGGLSVISMFVFIMSLVIASGPKMAQSGDVFVHANPGKAQSPYEPNIPFAGIYKVTEIKDGSAHVEGYWFYLDGDSVKIDRWDRAYGLGKIDVKVSR